MIYLSGVVRAELAGEVGFMLQPGMGNRLPAGATWAADNGCFAAGGSFDAARWLRWLDHFNQQDRWRCLFATAPDVVGDAARTWRRSLSWFHSLRMLGFHPALVAQDGFDAEEVDWSLFDCLFLGGTTTWKLSPAAREAAREARTRGKWVHMGRVNSLRRLRGAVLMGCDSVDGTFLRRAPDQNIPRLRTWLRRLRDEPFLPLAMSEQWH